MEGKCAVATFFFFFFFLRVQFKPNVVDRAAGRLREQRGYVCKAVWDLSYFSGVAEHDAILSPEAFKRPG